MAVDSTSSDQLHKKSSCPVQETHPVLQRMRSNSRERNVALLGDGETSSQAKCRH